MHSTVLHEQALQVVIVSLAEGGISHVVAGIHIGASLDEWQCQFGSVLRAQNQSCITLPITDVHFRARVEQKFSHLKHIFWRSGPKVMSRHFHQRGSPCVFTTTA